MTKKLRNKNMLNLINNLGKSQKKFSDDNNHFKILKSKDLGT